MAQPSRRAIVPQGISVIWVSVPCTLFRQSLNEHETPGCKSASHGCRGVAELVPTFCPSTTVNMSTGPRMVARVVEFLDDQHETVTLQAETRTPRRRPLSANFKRVRTPPGELPPARRVRLNAESSVCSRAMCRLDPETSSTNAHARRRDRRSSTDRGRRSPARCASRKSARGRAPLACRGRAPESG